MSTLFLKSETEIILFNRLTSSIRQRNTAALTWVSKRKTDTRAHCFLRVHKQSISTYTNVRTLWELNVQNIYDTYAWTMSFFPGRPAFILQELNQTMIAQMIRSRPPTLARKLSREGCWSQNGWLPSFTKGLVQLHTNLYTKLKTKLTMTVACRYGRSMFKLPLIAASIIHKKNAQTLTSPVRISSTRDVSD